MPYCQHCGKKIDEDDVFCPECGRSIVGEDREWQQFKLLETIDRVKRRADMYVALAAVSATVGVVVGGALCIASHPSGLFGIALVCFAIGFAAAAKRHDRKVESLGKWLSRSNSVTWPQLADKLPENPYSANPPQ
ncbi:MAG: zinc-ribbon domain-containing protein [Dehalococcoidia bacterium]